MAESELNDEEETQTSSVRPEYYPSIYQNGWEDEKQNSSVSGFTEK